MKFLLEVFVSLLQNQNFRQLENDKEKNYLNPVASAHFYFGRLNQIQNGSVPVKAISERKNLDLTIIMATISPNKPIALAKISTIRIFTKSTGLAASAKAAPEPTIPTAIPQTKLLNPTVRPAANMI